MKIRELRLVAFGPFDGTTLDFVSAGAAGLHVIYGPNEAGKSSALRAVLGLLFGIPETTPDAHRHKMPDLRVGAVLEGPDGAALELVRRKGRKHTLLDPAGAPLDEALLARLCGGTTEGAFRTLHGLDHVTLREGAEALLAGGGEIGAGLFQAALGGGPGIHRVLAALRREADDIWKRTGRNPALNEALRAYDAAQAARRERSRSGEEWTRRAGEIEEARARQREIRAALEADRALLRRLLRGKLLLGPAARRAHAAAELAGLADVPPLPPEARDERLAALAAQDEAARERGRLAGDLDELAARLEALAIPAWLEEARAPVQALPDRIGAYRKAARDRRHLEGERAALLAELAEARARLPTGAGAGALGPAEQARIATLARQEAALEQRDRASAAALRELEETLARAGAERAALPPCGDLPRLEAQIARVQEANLDAALRSARRELERARLDVARRRAPLGLPEAAPVTALGVPTADAIARAAAEAQRLEAEAARLAGEEERHGRRAAELARALDALRRGGELPTEEALLGARRTRDGLWQALRRALAGTPDPSDAPDAEALLAFERATARADELADRLRREADRVAQLAALEADARATAADGEALAGRRRELEGRRGACEARWRALWAPAGVTPGGTDEMRAWRRDFDGLLEATHRLEALERDAAAAEEDAARAERALAAAVAAADPTRTAGGALPLDQRLEEARATAAALAARVRRLAELDAEVARAGALRDRTRRELDEVARERAAWRTEWARGVAPLGLPPDAGAAEASALLAELAALAAKESKRADLDRRIDAIAREARAFEEEVGALTSRFVPEEDVDVDVGVDVDVDVGADAATRSGSDVDVRAERLVARFEEGRRAAHARAQLEEARARKLEERRAAEARLDGAAARLGRLLQAGRVDDLSALEQVEQRAARRRALEAQLAEIDRELLDRADGLALEEALAEARAHAATGVDLEARIAELRQRIDARDAEATAQSERLGALEAEARAFSDAGASGAAEAADDAAAELARIRGLAERWARLRLGARLLEREIERYRERNQGPILARASALLARLTLGRYVGLRADYDDADRAVVRCLRGDGAKIPIEGLSDGTRDQLYLALRLATLEQQAKVAPPLPLVLDDVLVHFDDDRARAALEVLGEVAVTRQILFFSHHRRLVDLAREAVAPERLVVHELGRPPLLPS